MNTDNGSFGIIIGGIVVLADHLHLQRQNWAVRNRRGRPPADRERRSKSELMAARRLTTTALRHEMPRRLLDHLRG